MGAFKKEITDVLIVKVLKDFVFTSPFFKEGQRSWSAAKMAFLEL